MVLKTNITWHKTNKFVVDFLKQNIPEDQLSRVLEAWKDSNKKFKTCFKTVESKLPKRITSKYLFFCQDERPKIIQENPGMSIQDITCILGQRWRQFQKNPDPEREAYIQNLFDQDKKRYDDSKGDPQLAPIKQKTKSQYLLFCEKERQKKPNIKLTELGPLWQQQKQIALKA